jgi:hypothetical protein
MKTINKLIIFIFIFLAMGTSAYANTPREELQKMVEQLRKAPNDNVLREKIIKLGAEIKPSPAIPEEANRAFVKGNIFQKEGKDASSVELAVSAYQEALRFAPWWGDAYYNLSVAQASASRFGESIASLTLYLAATSPGSAEARDGQNKIYEIEAKKELELAKKNPSIAGNWKIFVNGSPQKEGDSTGNGGEWAADYHYRLEMTGQEAVVYLVTDSDPGLIKDKSWCRRAGGRWACKGDEDIFGRFSVDGHLIRGRFLQNNLNGKLFGTFNEAEIRWDFEYTDQYGTHPNHEVLRKQD